MKGQYTLSAADLREFIEWASSYPGWRRLILALQRRLDKDTDPELRQLRAVACLICGLLCLAVGGAYLALAVHPAWALVTIWTVLFVAIGWSISRRRLRAAVQSMANDPHLLGPWQVHADEHGLDVRSDFREYRLEWHAAREVIELPSLVLIRDNTPECFILPRRLWPTPESAAETLADWRRHIRAACQTTPQA